MIDCCAAATDSVASTNTALIPATNAPTAPTPANTDDRLAVPTTTDKNTGNVHDSDATPYDIPNPTIDDARRSNGPTPAATAANRGVHPNHIATPAATNPAPTASAAYGTASTNTRTPIWNSMPSTPNTTANPNDPAATTPSARLQRCAAGTAPSSADTNNARYAGNIANPHGFTVATIPDVNANANGTSITTSRPRPTSGTLSARPRASTSSSRTRR